MSGQSVLLRCPAPPRAPTKIPVEYVNFADVFSPDLAFELPEHTGINDHSIELVDTNGFNRPSTSPAGASILFDRESDGSFWLCVDYRGPNNLIIAMSVLRWPVYSR